MKILVDTSVWADFFNGVDGPCADQLARHIKNGEEIGTCGLIISEFFQGLRSDASVRKLRPYFESMTLLIPHETETYHEAAVLFRKLRKKGFTIRSTVDCIIACLAVEHGFNLL